MPYLLIRHKVEDYAKWKSEFDKHGDARKASGFKGGYIFHNADAPNEVLVLMEIEDMEKARQFAQSEEVRQAMQRAGVLGKPDVIFLDEVERLSV